MISSCGNVTFLSLNKKVTKEVSQRGSTKMRPLWKPQPHRHPTPENVPIFGRLPQANLQSLSCRCSKIGTFLDTGRRCARRGFLRGHAFSECPLKSPSFGTFLGEARKVHNGTLVFLQSEFSPQPLWNVENFPVEKPRRKNASTGPVDKFFFSTIGLWRKNRCVPNGKGTFPHNFVLPLLRLKNL